MIEEYLQVIRTLAGKQDVANEAIAIAIIGATFIITAAAIIGGAAYSLTYTLIDQPTRVAYANAQAATAKALAEVSAAASKSTAQQVTAMSQALPQYPPEYVTARPVARQFTRRSALASQAGRERVTEQGGRVVVEIPGTARDFDNGFVYVIKGESNYKIGMARNIQHRLKQLSTGHEHGLSVYHSIASNAMSRAESSLHKRFAHLRVRGEWFKLGEAELAYLKSIARIDVTTVQGSRPTVTTTHTNGTTPKE